jgi:predicted DNA-binding transcriptional regulator YafY
VDDAMVEAYCRLRGDERNFNIGRINWARLTGETFEVGLDFV